MSKLIQLSSFLIFFLFLSVTAFSEPFKLSSRDISHGEFMDSEFEFQGFGCDGENLSPQLSWSGAPSETVAFALTAYDPDAPTGSGWWHWQIVNIPKSVTTLERGAGDPNKSLAPKGSIQIANDYGIVGFGGACPPPGDGAHRYQFTVHALSKHLALPANASGALTGYMINALTLEKATIESLYKR